MKRVQMCSVQLRTQQQSLKVRVFVFGGAKCVTFLAGLSLLLFGSHTTTRCCYASAKNCSVLGNGRLGPSNSSKKGLSFPKNIFLFFRGKMGVKME